MQAFVSGKVPFIGRTKPEQTPVISGKIKKMVRIMKITAIILLVGCLQVSAGGHSQTITLSEKNAPLQKIFKAIERQTDYVFFYDYDWLQKAKKVTIEAKNIPLLQALDICFKDQPLTYSIVGKNILIGLKDGNLTIEKEQRTSPKPPLSSIEVRGVITDENGIPLQGVNIAVKGTNKGTSTNIKGEFVLNNVDENAVLIISSVGYESQEIPVNSRTFIAIQLNISVSKLDEVQIIAYGQTTQRLNTGNVTTVKATDLEKQPVQNPLLALQGRVPGLFVTQNTGVAGGGVTVRIQGQNSIQSGNDPLYVIDGVPIISQLPRTGIEFLILGNSGNTPVGAPQAAGNPLSYLNPSDIESIEVLKDADATAIYGSRAANGAILITTKKAKPGKTKLDVNLQRGWGKVTRKLKMLNTRQYLDMRYEAYQNDGISISTLIQNSSNWDLTLWDTTRYTDWQKVLIGGTAAYSNINASLSGGSANIQYLLGATYHKETTVFPVSDDYADQKASVHFSLNNISANQNLRMQFSGNYMFDNNQLPGRDLTAPAIQMEPDVPPLYKADGSLNWAPTSSGTSTLINPLADVFAKYVNKTTNLISSLSIHYRVIDNLEFGASVGYTNMQTDDYNPTPIVAIRPERRNTIQQRTAAYGNRNINSWIIEPQITYRKEIAKGKLETLLGSTFLENNSKGGYMLGTGYTSDEVLKNMRAAASISTINFFSTQYKYNAIFGRLNYNWQNKYIFNLTLRRDGSSRFGSNNRFHNFGAVGAAWLFTQEGFVQKNLPFLSFGKIKGSYGTTGNDQINDYQYLSLYGPVSGVQLPYQNTAGVWPLGLPNPNLQWEETKKLQVGLDLGFIKDKLLFNVTYSRNRSSNQLLPYDLPSITGSSNIPAINFPATIQNRIWEVSINTKFINTKSIAWTIGINLTIPKNKLVKFPDLENSAYANSLVIGEPLDVQKLYQFLGVDPEGGFYKFQSTTDPFNPVFSTDATVLVSSFPKYYGGFQNGIEYKGFQLDFLIQFVKQIGQNLSFGFPASIIQPGNFFRVSSNQPATVLDRWHKPGDNASVKKISTTLFNSLWNNGNNVFGSDGAYTDASYIRLKNLALSWNFPSKWQKSLQMQNGRIYIQGQNLLTITNYDGLDPENRGYQSLPPLRVWTIGIQAGF